MFGRESLREFIRREQEKTCDLIRREQEKTREFEREILLRNEKVYTSVIAEMEKNGKQIEESTARMRAGTEQLRANTKAVLSVLDRLDATGA